MGYRVSILTSGNLDELHRIWELLLPAVERISFYHSWEWISGVAKYLYADSPQLAYLIVWQDKTPVALFPLELREHRLMGVVPDTEIYNLSHVHLPFNDWLCSSAHDPARVLGVLLKNLESFTSSRWYRFGMRSVPDETSLANAVLSMTAYRKQKRAGESSYYFDCMDTSLAQIIPPRLRRNLARRRRLADEMGKVTFEYSRAVENDAFTEALESFFKLEASGWKGLQGRNTAIALSPVLREFYKNLAKADHSRYRCQINLMKIDDHPMAGQFCFHADDCTYLIKIGFDESFKRCSPGSLLLQDFLQRSLLCTETRRLSLVTAPPWANRWHPRELQLYDIKIFNNTLPGSMQLLQERAREVMSRLAFREKIPGFFP